MSLRTMYENALQQVVGRSLLAVERIRTGVSYDPFNPRLYSDPYPIYARLRERDPVHPSRLFDGVIVSRYADVISVLRDPSMSADESNGRGYAKMRERAIKLGIVTAEEIDTVSLLRSDAPDHSRLRQLVNKGFKPRAIQKFAPLVERIVAERIDAVARLGEFDLLRDVAFPVPVTVIAAMLGVPTEDHARFKRWSDEIVLGLGFNTIEEARRSNRAGRELRAYLKDIADQRRRDPRDDLLSVLVLAEEDGDRLTENELFATCNLLLVAGNETTTNLIGNGMLALLRNPEQLERLRSDPGLIDSAISELLRFDSPVQATSRIAREDVVIGGRTLEKGRNALVLLGSANRDPEVFENPDRLDLTREAEHHLSFGHGAHFCLGSRLARLEARTCIGALVERFPDLRLSAEPGWRRNLILRGVESLPVAV